MTLLPASRDPFTTATILEVSEIATAVVRFRGVTMTSLSSIYDRAFGALRQAIAAGATHLRIGSAITGKRPDPR